MIYKFGTTRELADLLRSMAEMPIEFEDIGAVQGLVHKGTFYLAEEAATLLKDLEKKTPKKKAA
jgi:hypothetical protein